MKFKSKKPFYLKKPLIVEAFQMTLERRNNNIDWPEWLHEAWQKPVVETGSVFCNPDGCMKGEPTPLFIQTLEGTQKVGWGDYIMRGEKGELLAHKPDIFDKIFEPVHNEKVNQSKGTELSSDQLNEVSTFASYYAEQCLPDIMKYPNEEAMFIAGFVECFKYFNIQTYQSYSDMKLVYLLQKATKHF